MKNFYFVFAMSLLLAANCAVAETGSITAKIGDTEITIPSPKGYYEGSQLSPEVRKFAEQATPNTNRLIGVFVSEPDLGLIMKEEFPKLKRYMLAQTNEEFESHMVSIKDFEKISSYIKSQNEASFKEVMKKYSTELNNISEQFYKKNNIKTFLNQSKTVMLGVFLDKRNSIGYAMLSKYKTEYKGVENDQILASGSIFLNIKNKILYAYVYSTYNDQNDLDWVREVSKKWANSIMANNISNISDNTYSQDTDNLGINWDEVIGKGIAGGILGGIFAIFIVFFQLIKKYFGHKK